MDTDLLAPDIAALGYTWRPAAKADVPMLHQLLLATAAADDNPRVPVLEDLEREIDDPWSDLREDSRLFFAPDGSLAACARVFANPEPEEEARAYLDDEVHPDHRAALHEAVIGWLAERGTAKLQTLAAAAGFTGPAILRLGTRSEHTDRIAVFERHGFRPVRYFYHMRRDLSQPIPDVPLPAGLTLTAYRPELSEAARQALEEAFVDHWAHEPISTVDWEKFFVGSSTFRPDLTPIVLAGDQVAAVSFNKVDPEENTRQGYATGWIQTLGTRRPWRKRGLASALLAWSMRAFREAGLEFATLGVDAENPTGALGLYEGLGFVVIRRYTAFGRPVALTEGG